MSEGEETRVRTGTHRIHLGASAPRLVVVATRAVGHCRCRPCWPARRLGSARTWRTSSAGCPRKSGPMAVDRPTPPPFSERLVRDRGHQPALDGVRGLAILLVLGQHAPTKPLINGFVGVTVFFCLSGYLITSLLVRELQTGTIDVRTFYRRRAARLYPALVTVGAATIVVLLLDRPDLAVGQVVAPAGAAVTYSTSLFDWSGHFFATGDYFNYTWSLSVEEQFYLLWPFLLLWGYQRGPRRFAVLVASCIA